MNILWVRSVPTSSVSPLSCHAFPLSLDVQLLETCAPASSLRSSSLHPSPLPLPFALPAASGLAPARSNSRTMVPQARRWPVFFCFLLQLQGPLGTVGTEVPSVRGGFLCGLGELRCQAVCNSSWDINRNPLPGGSIRCVSLPKVNSVRVLVTGR